MFLRLLLRVLLLGYQRPEAAERRRVEAAAELQRQKEQEEWDRAFEEELVQTGLPEDVVAACVYQVLAVSFFFSYTSKYIYKYFMLSCFGVGCCCCWIPLRCGLSMS